AVIGELASSGEGVLVLCADALWRRGIIESAIHPGRLAETDGVIVAARGSLAGADRPGLVLADWAALHLMPELAFSFEHVVIADPAPHLSLSELANTGDGYVHVLASAAELSLRALDANLPTREELIAAYRRLRAAGPLLEGEALRIALAGESGSARSPEACARTLRVLGEVGAVRTAVNDTAAAVEVVSSGRGDLSSSVSFRAAKKAHEECVRYLSQPEIQSSKSLKAA
ncbi:MAG TPA: hypothetical protein VD766_07875, partial [Solirubrobacterales bacterium]|nr:hypothetical protein [Solirubrobacterales bacterium]